MSPGYGEKIYVKRPRRRLWTVILAILVALLGLAGAIALALRSGSADTRLQTDETSTPEPGRLSITAPVATIRNQNTPETPSPNEPKTGAIAPEFLAQPMPNPTDPDNRQTPTLAEAERLIGRRQFAEAIKLLDPLSERDPSAMLLAAQAHFALQHHAESRQLLERYLTISPDHLDSIRRLAVICYAQNQLEAALDYCERGLALDPADAELDGLSRKIQNELATAAGFTSRESQHFSVSFDRGSHDDARQTVLSILEDAYRETGRDLGIYPERSIPVILYTQKSFFDVTRAPGWAGGLYDGKIRIPVAGLLEDRDELERILTHEYVHALVHQLTDQCPRWINEGLAEYYSQSEVPEIGQIIPLERLEDSFPGAPVRAVAAAYAESHAAVAYLIERYSLADLIELLRRLGMGESLRQAFKDIFYSEYEQFLAGWGK